MRHLVILYATILITGTAFGQNLKEAIRQSENEQYGKAAESFRSLLKAEPTNGEYYFYYGENFFNSDNSDSALICYKKGTELNPNNPLNYVGLGKIQWMGEKEMDAKSNFYKATTLSAGKNPVVLMKIAETYIRSDKKDLKEAMQLLAQAEKLDPKNPEVFILKGDAYLEQNDPASGSEAIKNYNKAVDLDKKAVKAILRIGQLYGRGKNYTLAFEYYQNANKIDSSFAPAYRQKAELLFKAGQADKAVEQYKRYLALNNDFSARIRYAEFLTVAKDYKKAVEEISAIQQKDTSYINLYRMMGYASYETGNYPKGIESMEKFLRKAAAANKKVLPSDYAYYGKLLSKTGKDSLGVEEMKKAIALDTTDGDIYGEIGALYVKMKRYPEAIDSYNRKIRMGKGANANDYFGLGRAYYYSKNYPLADSAFKQITISNPNFPLGYLWRSRANSSLDPDSKQGLAKPHYEKFIEKAETDKEKNKKDLLEAYSYLGYYYALNKDNENAALYWGKVRDIDPNNKQQKEFFSRQGK